VADALSRVFSALADPTRRDMVARLSIADATVNELAEPYEVSVQAVSKHLRVLEERYRRLDALLRDMPDDTEGEKE
jgi:DNA-binding transcriptional ArsR family regulator